MDAFARWLVRHSLAVVVANLVVTAILGLFALHVRIESSLESMLPSGDPKVEYYARTRAIFGSDDVGVVGVRADDIFAPATMRKIMTLLTAEGGPEQFFYTGAAHVKQSAVELMQRDITRFTPMALVFVLLVLWLSYRTVRGVVLPVVTVSLALVWTLGVIVLAGKAITLGTFILPPLLLVLGSSYAIHVMARYYEQVGAGVPPGDRVPRAFARVWLPLTV